MIKTKLDAVKTLLESGWTIDEIETTFDRNIQHLDSFILPVISWPNYPEPTCSEIACIENNYYCKRLLSENKL